MRARLFASATIALLTLGIAVGCSYEPLLIDGTLRCSISGAECPKGYSCSACGTCWSDQLDGHGSGKLSGNAIAQPLLNRYVGEWALGTCANVVTTCDDGSTDTGFLSPDSTDPSIMYLDQGLSGSADLVSDWLCTLDLSLNSGGAHLYGRDQGCTFPNLDPQLPGLLQETWTARRFDVVTTSENTAMHSATYERLGEFADQSSLLCIQRVHAPLTKR